MRSWHCLPFLALLPALGSCGSTSVTEVVVRIETDMAVPCELTDISVEFDPPVLNGDSQAPPRYAIDQHLEEDVLPLQLTVVAEAGQMLAVTVRGWKGGSEVATQVGTVELKGDKSLMMAFDLAPDSDAAPPVSALKPRNLHAANTCPEVCNGEDDDGDDDIDEGVDNCEPCENACTEGQVCSNNVCREEDFTRYIASASSRQYRNACSSGGTMILAPGSSDAAVMVPIPEGLGFLFYGRPVTKMWVGADGWISFDDANPDLGGQPEAIDAPGLSGNAIYAFWDDIKLVSRRSDSNGKVCVGTAGNPDTPSSFYVTWSDVCLERSCESEDSIDVMVELMADSKIYIAYGDAIDNIHKSVDPTDADGALATIGVRDVAALACSATECGLDGRCMSGANKDKPCGFTSVGLLSDLLAAPGVAGNHSITWRPAK